jgi:predicted  nucleic acid-binding Zn-ribbon protein
MALKLLTDDGQGCYIQQRFEYHLGGLLMSRFSSVFSIMSVIIVIPALPAQAQELTVEQTSQEIQRIETEYNKLVNDINAKEQELMNLMEQIRSCRVSRYDTSRLQGDITALGSRLNALKSSISKIDISTLENEINRLNQEIDAKKAELEANKAELARVKADLSQRKKELAAKRKDRDRLWRKISEDRQRELTQLQNNLDRARGDLARAPAGADTRSLQNAISEIARQCDDLERRYKIPGHRRMFEECRDLQASISHLQDQIQILNQKIRALPAEIKSLQNRVKAMSSDIKNYYSLKYSIEGLGADLALLKDKLNQINSLLAKKKEMTEEPDSKKTEQKRQEIQEEVRRFKEKMRRIYELKNLLLKQLRKMDQEPDPERKKSWEDEIKKTKGNLGKECKEYEPEEKPPSKPSAPPEEIPAKQEIRTKPKIPDLGKIWELVVKYTHCMFSMAQVNDYLHWINNNYSGNISDLDSGQGLCVDIFYQVNNTLGFGLAYEHLAGSADGTISNPWPPPGTLKHGQDLSCDGFLGQAAFTLPPMISGLDIRTTLGAGLYLGHYKETENGYEVAGNGSGLGFKVGLRVNYSFVKFAGICGQASYRGIKVNAFTDSAGDRLRYIPAYGGADIKADFSGLGFSAGLYFVF